LLCEDLAGDPTGRQGLWTDLRLEQISDQLKGLGLAVCPNTVRRLLEGLDIALHVNRKSLSGPQSPERDAQFQYIRHQREQFSQHGLPSVSVDTKKRELVGRFKNDGQVWSQEALRVKRPRFSLVGPGRGHSAWPL
jgi:hypothetical protein